MIGPELLGEDFSELTWESEHEQKRKPGRPRKIEPESLSRAVNDLQFVLEQNWGIVGWLLLQAKTPSDVRSAFERIVNQNCRYLEPFTEHSTCEITSKELRSLGKRAAETEEQHRLNHARCQHAKESFERAFGAWVAESDPVKRAEIQRIRPALARTFEEAGSLAQSSGLELESLRTELRECEAFLAQSEILSFVQSNRRHFTPLNVARAMAGLPRVTARVSCELCTKYGINPSHGIEFEMFQTIESMVPEPIRDLGRSIETLRELLINGPQSDLPHVVQLRKNWYFLESAIRSAARDASAQRGSLAFRIYAEYRTTSASHSNADEVIAQANRLLKGDEDPEPERGSNWCQPLQRRARRGTGHKC